MSGTRPSPTTRSDAKDLLYSRYVSTHTGTREPEPTKEHFSAKTRAWDRRLGWSLPSDPSARVLDLGCGSGSIVYWLQHHGFSQAEGVDVSAEVVAQATASGVANVRQADARVWLAGRQEHYDLVYMRDVLEHFSLEEGMELLAAVHGALRPDGRLVLQVPNAESPLVGRVRWGDLTHEGAYTPGSISQLVSTLGYTFEEARPVVPFILGRRTVHRFLIWKFVEVLYRFLGYAEGEKYHRVVTQNMLVAARR